MKNERYLRTKLRKIKKNWPSNLTPYLLPSGQLRLVRSLDENDLGLLGISSLTDAVNYRNLDRSIIQTPSEKRAVNKLLSLIEELPSIASPDFTFPILSKYFPSILERL